MAVRMNGTFTALGYDDFRASNPSFFLPRFGLVQLVLLILLNVYAHVNFLFLPIPLIGNTLALSLVIAIASAVTIGFVGLNRTPVSLLSISYTDEGNSEAPLRISYDTPKGKHRYLLAVREVHAFPNDQLVRVVHYYQRPVAGTKSSIAVRFDKPRIRLLLGFPNESEMDAVYKLLMRKSAA